MAGREWHEDTQKQLAAQGLQAVRRPLNQKIRFGDGRIVDSDAAYMYPVGLGGADGALDVALVDRPCPALLSNKAMRGLGIWMDFGTDTMGVRSAGIKDAPMRQAASRPPLMSLTDYSPEDRCPPDNLACSTVCPFRGAEIARWSPRWGR